MDWDSLLACCAKALNRGLSIRRDNHKMNKRKSLPLFNIGKVNKKCSFIFINHVDGWQCSSSTPGCNDILLCLVQYFVPSLLLKLCDWLHIASGLVTPVDFAKCKCLCQFLPGQLTKSLVDAFCGNSALPMVSCYQCNGNMTIPNKHQDMFNLLYYRRMNLPIWE
jgi:hypothetical protein